MEKNSGVAPRRRDMVLGRSYPIQTWLTFTIEGFTVRYTVTIFYDLNGDDGAPTYLHKSKTTADETRISLTDEGRLCKLDLGGRWRTVDESGTGLRAGSTRPPDIPSDAYELRKKRAQREPVLLRQLRLLLKLSLAHNPENH